jgi:hypothetical protein
MKLRRFAVIAVACVGVAAAGMTSAPRALAYGHAAQPLAQLTFSQNCMNPEICGANGAKGGFGQWGWIEIDSGGYGDAAGAGCGHLQGFGAGGGGGPGPITWVYGSAADAATGGFQIVAIDPYNSYYLVSPFGLAFPTTPGHYSQMDAPGIQTQVQVAP